MDGNEKAEYSWAEDLLATEKFFNQLLDGEKQRILNEAVDFGSHLAEKVRERIGSPDGTESIRKMLISLGCGLRIDDEVDLPGPMSEYEEDLLAARFFTRRIRTRAEQAAERDEWHAGWLELFEQCLARELFHHVENTISGKASHHIRIKRNIWGVFPASEPVESSRIIAGIVFVKEFLNLKTIPVLMLYD